MNMGTFVHRFSLASTSIGGSMETVQASGSAEGTNTNSNIGGATPGLVGETVNRVSQAAGEVIEQAKSKGGSIAIAATGTAKDLLGQRIAAGGEWIGHLAESTKCAADSLQDKSPEFAGLVRQVGADSLRLRASASRSGVRSLRRVGVRRLPRLRRCCDQHGATGLILPVEGQSRARCILRQTDLDHWSDQ
jgi:hypothetical protein